MAKINQKSKNGSVNLANSTAGDITTGHAPLPDPPAKGESLLTYLHQSGVDTSQLAMLLTSFILEGYNNLNYNRASMEDTHRLLKELDTLETVRDFAILLDVNPLLVFIQPTIS